MDNWSNYAALDLGGESGRACILRTDGKRIEIAEHHRYINRPVLISGHLYWNVAGIFQELKAGIESCARAAPSLSSVAIDTWGTDFGFVSKSDELVGLPFSYRDHKNDSMLDLAREMISDSELYSMTGIQVMKVNSLYQLLSLVREGLGILEAADRLLFMPDLFAFLLCGAKTCEYTMASTSQLMDPVSKTWATELFERLELPIEIMPEIVPSGTDLGTILPEQACGMGVAGARVRACATHDTASAVAAVPVVNDGKPWAFISSGTWSLVGTEIDRPVLTEEAREVNVTNEGGIDGTIRLLKNVTGMWLVQRLRRDLSLRGTHLGYDEIAASAEAAEPFARFIDPDDWAFHNPSDMVAAIDAYCAKTRQSAPVSPGEYARCIYESLAYRYREVIAALSRLTGKHFARIHIIGGGAQVDLLNSFTADACGIEVYAGPYEATAIGNGIVQALSDGVFTSLADARSAVGESFDVEIHNPANCDLWERDYYRFNDVTGNR